MTYRHVDIDSKTYRRQCQTLLVVWMQCAQWRAWDYTWRRTVSRLSKEKGPERSSQSNDPTKRQYTKPQVVRQSRRIEEETSVFVLLDDALENIPPLIIYELVKTRRSEAQLTPPPLDPNGIYSFWGVGWRNQSRFVCTLEVLMKELTTTFKMANRKCTSR